MPLIISATDFSEVANHAVEYACQLAQADNAELVVLNSFILPVMFSDVPVPAPFMNEAQKDAETQMGSLVSMLAAKYPGLAVSGKVIYADAIDALEDFRMKGNAPSLAIIGNSSLAGDNSWPDSVLVDALKTVQYPILAVPPGAAFRPVARICFAMDNKQSGYASAILSMRATGILPGAEWHVLNIGSDETEILAKPDDALAASLAGLDPVYHIVENAADIDTAIINFAENNNFDWLVVMPRRHSFFNALLHKSHTDALARHSHIPILAVHEGQ